MDIKGTKKIELMTPLHCWDLYSVKFAEHIKEAKTNYDLNLLRDLKERFEWNLDVDSLSDFGHHALVITDTDISIKWVSDGFTKMTGYAKKEAIGRSPRLLQGENTTMESRQAVRKSLSTGEVFETKLVNYRKNGEEYLCEVQIHPIYNENGQLMHYLALEKEVK
jgi:PAS domain S-box-containing protein